MELLNLEYCQGTRGEGCPNNNTIQAGLLHKSCRTCQDSLPPLRRDNYYTHFGNKDSPHPSDYGIVTKDYGIKEDKW